MLLPDLPRVNLRPGMHYATNKPQILSTLLGSCVSACLYDPEKQVAGMNHFMLVNRRYSRNMPMTATEAGRYGVHAMELLINDMLALGAERKHLRAKVFGAGAVLDDVFVGNFQCVGDINKRFILEYLETEKIPLEASDLGGNQGRIIRFRTDNQKVYRRFIVRTATIHLEKKEEFYWKKNVTQDHSSPVILFKDL